MVKRNIYQGRRYVPKIVGAWDNVKMPPYESLTVVQWGGLSYTSKRDVPQGVSIHNEYYWVITGNYNAQVEIYRKEVVAFARDKINFKDIVNNLIDGGAKKVLSAEQGKILDDNIKTLSQRLQDLSYNIKDFGAKGDGIEDDTFAIQKCIDYAQRNYGNVAIPIGRFNISKSLTLSNQPISFVGTDFKQSVISATAPMKSMFTFDDSKVNDGFSFENFTLEGNYNTKYCISSEKLTHTRLYRVLFRKSTDIGLRIGWGWSNDIIECRLQYHRGNAIEYVSSSNHLNNIVRCKILENDGFGVVLQSGRNVNITECQIQENKKGGIYHKVLGSAIVIGGNYFEQNGLEGYDIKDPTFINIKADIIINGSPVEGAMSPAYSARQVSIRDNTHYIIPNSSQTCAYYLIGVDGIEINNNSKTGTNDTVPMVGTFIRNNKANVSNMVIGDNGWKREEFLRIDNVGDGQFNSMNTWSIWGSIKPNLLTDKFDEWETNYPFTSSTLTNAGIQYYGKNVGVIEMKGKGNSSYFGTKIDMAKNPDLKGQVYYVSVKVRQSSNTMGALINTTSSGRNTPFPTTNMNWRTITHVGRFPLVGTEQISVQLYAGNTGDKLYLTMPVISIPGVNANELY